MCTPLPCRIDTVSETERIGGRLKLFKDNWTNYPSDSFILDSVTGCTIEFEEVPTQLRPPKVFSCSRKESDVIDTEILKLLNKGVIAKTHHDYGEFISPILTRPKKNGTHRVIVNLEKLNKSVVYHHFKMYTMNTCISLLKEGSFLASIDLRDAYYTVPVHLAFQKFLKFFWKGTLYCFTCLPNGLACAPRIFTKILKPVCAFLRGAGHVSSFYLDDAFLVGDSYADCESNTKATLQVLRELGFVIHEEKSKTVPSQIIEHLGFEFNTIEMTVKVTKEKIDKVRGKAASILRKNWVVIREVAQLIGVLVACFPGVEFRQLFYRQLEIDKAAALKLHKGDFDQSMVLSDIAKQDLVWWIEKVGMGKKISHGYTT